MQHGKFSQWERINMNKLLENLNRFNSKERFFLVGQLLGNRNFVPSPSYLAQLSKLLNLKISSVKFSAMDFHLDWLYACLAHTDKPEKVVFDNSDEIVRGQQEDVDFVLGYEEGDVTHLILIEAKATTGWTNEQLLSKANRLAKIFGENGDKWDKVVPHFVITSPKQPSKIHCDKWPMWMKVSNEIAWIKLEVPANLQSVTRCDSEGNISSDGKYWKIQNR